LGQYLYVYCNYQQNNWSELLPLAEFAYNNASSATTGISPFFTNKEYHSNLSMYPEQDIASSHACDFVLNLDNERMQKGIAHWDKPNKDVLAPNCMLKVQEEIIRI